VLPERIVIDNGLIFTGSIWDLSWVAEWLLQALITTIAGNKSSRMLNDIAGLDFC